MAGSAEYERGDHAAALRYWEDLLGLLPPQSPQSQDLARAVEQLRLLAGR